MPVQINGNAMPTEMAAMGKRYQFIPSRVLGINGAGTAVTTGYAELTWEWTYLNDTEMAYLLTTVLAGAASKVCTGTTQLYNHLKVLTTFSHCVVHRPQYETYQYGFYRNVKLYIGLIK
jgi:hypothetical protein